MYSVPMSLLDFVPVFLFGAAAIILQKDLYCHMSKGAYAMFCAGTIDVFMAGFLKALYKLLYACNICDFERLSQIFFPLESLGFILAGIALVCMLTRKQTAAMAVAAPAVFSGTVIFIIMMVLGLGGIDFSLCCVAKKMKKSGLIALFIVSFIFSLMMGYLATKDFTQSYMNWIAEAVNTIGQLCLFIGVLKLDRAGLAKAEISKA